jgi:hypothetical protein
MKTPNYWSFFGWLNTANIMVTRAAQNFKEVSDIAVTKKSSFAPS